MGSSEVSETITETNYSFSYSSLGQTTSFSFIKI